MSESTKDNNEDNVESVHVKKLQRKSIVSTALFFLQIPIYTNEVIYFLGASCGIDCKGKGYQDKGASRRV